MEAILWKIRTGAQRREVPVELCPLKTAFNRFNRWAQKGLWNIFFALRKEADTEWIFVAATLIDQVQGENLFARLKHFRSISTRFEKLARNFKSVLFFACTILWLKLQTPSSVK